MSITNAARRFEQRFDAKAERFIWHHPLLGYFFILINSLMVGVVKTLIESVQGVAIGITLMFLLGYFIFDEKMSVRDVEKEIKRMNSKKPAKEKPGEEELEKDYVDHMKTVEEQLKQKTGTKVLISPKTKQSGKIEIDYFSNEEFEKIVACFNEIL